MRGRCKRPGGKLVAVDFHDGGTRLSCRIDGDFFVDGDDAAAASLMADIGESLAAVVPSAARNVRAGIDATAVRAVAVSAVDAALRRHPGTRLIGTDADAIATALLRAIGGDDAAVRDAVRCGALDDGSDGHPAVGREAAGIGADVPGPVMHPGPPSPDWRAFWRDLAPVVVHDRPRAPEEQMDVDERWAREVAAGDRPATLRFWEWSAPAVVVGRFQSIPDEVNVDEVRRLGFHIVRRCTGGGAMVVEPAGTITYSLYVPSDADAGDGDPGAWRLYDGWLVDALRGLGLDAGFQGLNDIASSRGKIGGSARRRFPPRHGGPGATLHHVTMAYDLDGATMARVLNTSREKLSDKAVRSASGRVDPLRSQTGLPREAVVAALMAAAGRAAAGQAPPSVAPDGHTIDI